MFNFSQTNDVYLYNHRVKIQRGVRQHATQIYHLRKVEFLMTIKPKIVILGAGYAGLKTTRNLTKMLSPEEAILY